jgi:hypothetical protein
MRVARPIPAILAALAVEKPAQVPDRVRVAVIAVTGWSKVRAKTE